VWNTYGNRNGNIDTDSYTNGNTCHGLRRELRWSDGTCTACRLDDGCNRSRVTVGDVDDDT
jgi:hypothetical protein